MTRAWLGWATLVSLGTVLGCGSGSQGFAGDDTGSGKPDSSMNDGQSGSDGMMLSSDGGGPTDSTVHDGKHVPDTSGLDITLPDGFTSPEEGTDTSSGSGDSSSGGCSPDGITCSGSTAITCSGGVETMKTCSGTTSTCAAGYGCVVCTPGSGSCSGTTGTLCNSDGTGTTTNDCDPELGLTCLGGVCTGACADIGESYIGCEYYAATLLNHLIDQTTFYFSVSIGNQGTSPATVTITGGALTTTVTTTIAPGAIWESLKLLPWVPAISCGAGPCCGDANGCAPAAPTTALTKNGAYHIKSTQPVTVYEFNARDYVIGTEYSYTNDASLLLPVNAMTGNYYVASKEAFYEWPALIAIIATTNGTSVTLTPSSDITAGAGLTATGGTITMNQGDVLQVTNPTPGTTAYGGDLSGSKVTATQPVEVIGGVSCEYTPATEGYCDHLEQVNFPLETLGTNYLVALPYNQNDTPRQFVKIIGTVNGTTLTYNGITGEPASVNAGGVVTFETTSDFEVTASNPIEVGQYMEGQNDFGTPCVDVEPPAGQTCGDPSMSLAVATAQFRSSYAFTAPPNYYQNWVSVIAPNGASVTVTDCGGACNHTVSGGTAIGPSYYVANVSLCADSASGCTGAHSASSTSNFGIQVYGYGSYTSYMYPGGLNLTR
jgi:IgGFc binding protein